MLRKYADYVAALTLVGATFVAAPALGAVIKVDGSSTVYPITDAVAVSYQKHTKNAVSVTIGISGTSGGFRKFCRGEIDIADASRPIDSSEMRACQVAAIEYIELPVGFDALTIVVNPRNRFLTSITVDELKRLWEPVAQGVIKTWRQVNANWPNDPVKLFGPGIDSGTFDYFTEAIVGKARSSRRDYTASEDDNVLVQGVAREDNALGYFGYAYYADNKAKLRAVPVAEKLGVPAIGPSQESVVKGTYRPLSRPIFIYVNAKSLARPEVRNFVEFYLKNGAKFTADAKYVPLPDAAYETALERVREMQKGSVFHGSAPIGVTLEELLRLETKQ